LVFLQKNHLYFFCVEVGFFKLKKLYTFAKVNFFVKMEKISQQKILSNENLDFPALTGLRAILASLIFINHYVVWSKYAPSFTDDLLIGVSMFYTLSGFLIMFRYSQNCTINYNWLKPYFIKRFARIYPVYFILLLIHLYSLGDSYLSVLFQTSLLHNFFEYFAGKVGINTSWSLTVEETFYFMAPLLMLLFRKNILYPLVLLISLLLLVLLYSLSPLKTHFLEISPVYGTLFNSPFFVLFYTFFGRFLEFYLGMLLAWLLLKKHSFLDKLLKIPFKIGISLIGIGLVVFLLDKVGWGNEYTYINNFLLPFFTTLLILGLIENKGRISHWLSSPLLILLGKASYIFYLIHFTTTYVDWATFISIKLLKPFSYLFPQNNAEFMLWVGFALYFILLWSFSIIIYLLIEKPANYFIRKWAKV